MQPFLCEFFLTRKGAGFRLAQAFCMVGGGLALYETGFRGGEWIWIFTFLLFLGLQVFAAVRWYPQHLPRCGIEDHFDKVNIAVVWLSLVGGIFSYVTSWNVALYLLCLFLGFCFWFNAVMVYFHWHDKDPRSPTVLSGEKRGPNQEEPMMNKILILLVLVMAMDLPFARAGQTNDAEKTATGKKSGGKSAASDQVIRCDKPSLKIQLPAVYSAPKCGNSLKATRDDGTTLAIDFKPMDPAAGQNLYKKDKKQVVDAYKQGALVRKQEKSISNVPGIYSLKGDRGKAHTATWKGYDIGGKRYITVTGYFPANKYDLHAAEFDRILASIGWKSTKR